MESPKRRSAQPGVQPGASVHISSRTVDLEQYYTNEKLSRSLLTLAMEQDVDENALFVEPAVGEGAIYEGLPKTRRIGVELCEKVDISDPDLHIGQDFLTFALPPEHKDRSVIVVGNPPFGRDAQIRFLNHAAELQCKSLTVVFILGLSMRKWSNIFKVHKTLHLVDEHIVPKEMSYFFNGGKKVSVPTVIQIWTRKTDPRTSDPEFITEDSDFEVLPRGAWDEANIVLKRFASPNCLGDVGIVGKDIFIEEEGEGKQVNAYYQNRKRFGTVVAKSGEQGTLMLIKARDVDMVASRLKDLWKKGTFKEYVYDTTSNVGKAVCINREELFTLYNEPSRIMRERKYLKN